MFLVHTYRELLTDDRLYVTVSLYAMAPCTLSVLLMVYFIAVFTRIISFIHAICL